MSEQEYRCVNSKCRKMITEKNSYMSKSIYNFNGRMTICKDCLNDAYLNYYRKFSDIKTAIWHTCRQFDIPFIVERFSMVENQILDKNYAGEKAFYTYLQKLYSFKDSDYAYFEDGITDMVINISEFPDDSNFVKWGSGFSTDGYKFLNVELENWKKTHKCENQADETLLKEICIKEWELREARRIGEKTKDLTGELQALMKTAAVSGDKANVASGGKSAEAFGVWIKDIEEKRPAEWVEDKELFHDVDNVHKYFTDYVTRPTKNFITGSRDFNIDEDLIVKDGDI